MRRIDWLAVTMLLLFAAGLRIVGIGYGWLEPEYFPSYAPYGMAHEQLPVNPDSFHNVAIPVEMSLKRRLNPEFFNYPSLIINSNFVLYQLTGATRGLALEDRDGQTLRNYAAFPLYVFSRIYSVLGGLVMVACAYATARILAGKFAALCAGLLVGCSYSLVVHAHYVKPSIPATAWMMVAIWACAACLYSRGIRWRERMYILAGIATGLAASTFYNGAAVALIVGPAGLVLLYQFRNRRMLSVVLAGWLAMPLFFLLASPYILRDFGHFWYDVSRIVEQYKMPGQVHDFFIVDQWTGLRYLLTYSALFSLGIPAMLLMALGIAAAAKPMPSRGKNGLRLLVGLISFMLLTYSLVVLRTVRPGHSEHQLIQILPFVALLSAIGAGWLVERISLSPRLLMPGTLLLLTLQPLTLSVQAAKMFSQPDTRQIMLRWIHDSIPSGARFFVNGSYNVPLDSAIYPNYQHFVGYAEELPSGDDFDYLIISDARAFDIYRSEWIVSPAIIEEQRAYLEALDDRYTRLADIARPTWTGSEAMMNMAAYYHNPGLILYCLNPASCEVGQ
ncbi:MAG: phospholipid carrier-dependent glycosyltransferase [Chloroflexi bacterium]|nr:phospholipid carrier-dependent glycosyltransferase [Chloroflexota bacterium]